MEAGIYHASQAWSLLASLLSDVDAMPARRFKSTSTIPVLPHSVSAPAALPEVNSELFDPKIKRALSSDSMMKSSQVHYSPDTFPKHVIEEGSKVTLSMSSLNPTPTSST